MIFSLSDDRRPTISDQAWIAPTAVIIGEVSIGSDSSVWYNAVVRGDRTSITIGRRTNIQDGCVVHADPGSPVVLGDSVTVGHNVTLHGCTIGDNTLVGMGSTIMNDANIGAGCIIGAGALIPPGMAIPPRSLVVGAPAKIKRELSEDDVVDLVANADNYVEALALHRKAQPFM